MVLCQITPKPAPPSILQFLVPLLSAGSSKAAPVWMAAPVSSAPPPNPQHQQLHRRMGRCHHHSSHHADISHQIILLLSNIRSRPGFSQGTLRASVRCCFLVCALPRAGQVLPVSSYLTRQVRSCNNIYQCSSYEQQGPKSWSFIQRLGMVCALSTFPHPPAQTSPWLLQLPVMVALDKLAQSWRAKAKSLLNAVYLATLFPCTCFLLVIIELEPAARSKSWDDVQHGC